MYKKRVLIAAAAVLSSAMAFADVSRADFSAFRNARNAVATTDLNTATVAPSAPVVETISRELLARITPDTDNRQAAQFVSYEAKELGSPILSASLGDWKTAVRTGTRAAGKIVAGTLYSTDLNYRGNLYNYRLTLAKDTTQGAAADAYTLSGVYGINTLLKVSIDESAGKVTIPYQRIATSGNDDVMVAPMQFSSSGASYSKTDIIGSINADGVITLPGWGILITEGANAGRGMNFFTSSTINPANASVTAYNVANSKDEAYDIYISQTADNSLTFLGLTNVTADAINARITSSKQVRVPNSFVYAHPMYGDFYIFPCDSTGKKAVPGVDLIGEYNEGSIDFTGWVISARHYPTMYVGYIYKDIKVKPSFTINWPAAPAFSGTGTGSKADPYVITTVAQLQTIAAAISEGNDYSGVYFKLGADLDLSSAGGNAWQPLGSKATPFLGHFDGAGHTIKNLTVDGSAQTYMGIFGYMGTGSSVSNLNLANIRINSTGSFVGALTGWCEGSIDNVKVTSSILILQGDMAAGISGALLNAKISNCEFQGALQGNGSIAGIAGQCVKSKIINCHVRANLIHSGIFDTACHDAGGITGPASGSTISNCTSTGTIQDQDGWAASGGLAGRLISESVLSSSMTTMNIVATANNTIGNTQGSVINCYQGGLAGYASESELRDCLSTSYIIQNSKVAAHLAGGLLGQIGASYSFSSDEGSQLKNVPNLYNCYYAGQVNSASTESSKNMYGGTFILKDWTGELPYEVAFHNCYYDNQVALISGDEWGRATTFFTASLPAGFDAKVWKAEAGRYPVIAANAQTQVAQLASAPLLLADGQNSTKVSKDFTITPLTNVSWAISADDGLVQSNDVLAISGSNVTIKNAYGTEMLVADSKDGWGRKIYILSIAPVLFEGEGTAASPYLLKTPADFITLDNAVRNFNQGHEGDYFAVTNDIDFKDSKFAGVATNTGRSFKGHLDGRGFNIHNLNIDGITVNANDSVVPASSMQNVALFGVLGATGEIKNLNIAADCSFRGYAVTAGFVGTAYGRIDNCRNYAPVTAAHSIAGGIAGQLGNTNDALGKPMRTAVITGCYNAGTIIASYNTAGGIVGGNYGDVSLSQNDGGVYGKSVETTSAKVAQNSIGGIAGSMLYLTGFAVPTIDRCVNNATVEGTYAVGGIAGAVSTGSVTNSVNNAFVNCTADDTRRGALIGNYNGTVTSENNFYDSSINVNGAALNAGIPGATGLASAQLTAGAIEGLPAADFNFMEGMYPVLAAFKDEVATKTLRSMVAYFPENITRLNLNKNITLSSGSEWTLAQNKDFTIEGNTLKVTLPEGTSIPADTLKAVNGNYTKVLTLTVIPAILKGDGSASAPFLIETPADWNKLSDFMFETKYEYPGSHFRVVNDLDFKGDSIRLIAVNGVKFNGVFDGNGKTVSNFLYGNANSVSTASRWKGPNFYRGVNIGLFGTIGSEGTVKNLISNGSFEGCNNIGGLVGELYGTVEGCEHKGKIYATSSSYASGIASKVYAGGRIIDCVNSGSVSTKTTYAQGIAYNVLEGALIKGCRNTGKVSATTQNVAGIAYTMNGTITDCVNIGALSGTGNISGVVYTLGKNAKMENCGNEADILIGTKGGTVTGVVGNTTDNNDDLDNPVATSWIKNCYNTGDLSGKTNVFGVVNMVKKGVLVEDCYNTGDVTAVGTYGAFGFCGAISANDPAKYPKRIPTVIRRSWNSGNVKSETSSSSAAAGFGKSTAAGTTVENCYNLGNVTVVNRPTSSSAICVAGFMATISGGTISNCWNAGNVSAQMPSAAGFAGYVSGTDCTVVENCFNLGDVTGSNLYDNKGTLTAGNPNGTAGGLFGYISVGNPKITNCYNAGNVSGNNRVGGIAGGMFRPDAVIENVYNSGKVTCENSWWSGTIFTNNDSYNGTSFFEKSGNVYYDVDVTPGNQYRDFPGSAKTTKEMMELKMEGFKNGYGYPYLLSFEGQGVDEASLSAAGVSTAMYTLAEGDTPDNVTKEITLWSAPAVIWSTSASAGATEAGSLEISGNTAKPVKKGAILLDANSADKSYCRSFRLTLNPASSGIEGIDAGKTVKSTLFIDMQGRIIPAPVAGQPYVVKVTYTDGTSQTKKVINK